VLLAIIAAALAATPALLTLGPASSPPGVAAKWTVEGCVLRVRLENTGAAPIELDWTRSVYTTASSGAVPLVPGTSSQMSAMISIPPMVVPPGTFGEALVFRKDRLPADGNGCLFDVPSEGTLTLSIGSRWLTQRVTFRPDPEAVARQAAMREAAEAALLAERQRADAARATATAAAEASRVAAAAEAERVRAEQERLKRRSTCLASEKEFSSSERRWRTWSWVVGGAGVGMASLGGLAMISAEPEDRPSMIPAVAFFGVGGAAGWGVMQLRANALERRSELLHCERL
jgi:hypothetical protein